MRESITTLPTEIIEEILSYLSHNDVSALTQTSKRLWQVAAPRLRSGIPLLTGERARACVQRLAEDPHRAAQILEIHLPRLMPRRKPFPWPFTTIGRVLVATIGRVVPLPFAPVEAYPELRRVFTDALCNLTSLRILTVHSCQRAEIWDCRVIIPSLREIYIYPGAESWFLWHWAKRQHTLTTVQNRWKHADHRWRYPYLPNHRGPLALPYLHTLITDPEGATEVLPKSVVSDLTIQGLTKPSRFIEYPVDVTDSHSVDYEPPFLYNIVRSNERTPLRRITLSGTVDGICSVLRELQSRDSLPPRVRGFFELGYNESERDLLVHPQLEEVISTLVTLEVLEVYKRAVGPDYPDPAVAVEIPVETLLIEETRVRAWAATCTMLQVVRFPSNSKWIVNRENGELLPRMVL